MKKNTTLEDTFEVGKIKTYIDTLIDQYSEPKKFIDYIQNTAYNMNKVRKKYTEEPSKFLEAIGLVGLVVGIQYLYTDEGSEGLDALKGVLLCAGAYLLPASIVKHEDSNLYKKSQVNKVLNSISEENDLSREQSKDYLKEKSQKYFNNLEIMGQRDDPNSKIAYKANKENLNRHLDKKKYEALLNFIQ